MRIFLIGLFGTLCLPAWCQSVKAVAELTLEQCYAAARANYPLLKQQAILQQTGDLAVASLTTNRRLPQVSVNGQATWQSEVTKLPIDIPNLSVPTLSKDQYKLTADASYALYEGNLIRLQTEVQRATTATAQQQVEVELNRLKDQVNAFFLNVLLTDEHLRLTQTLLIDLRNRIDKLAASVRFGTASPMNLDLLKAETLRSEQRLAELNATRRGLRDALHMLTDLAISDSTRLVIDSQSLTTTNLSLNRPELQLYKAQYALCAAQVDLVGNKVKPRLSLFAQSGLGRPALNFLSNELRGFFIGGLRFNWNLSAAYTIRQDRQTIQLNQQAVAIQQATFEKNLSVQLRQQQTEMDRLQSQLAQDAEIVALRTKVRQTAAVQLDNGVIAARDYTTELTTENQALLNQKLHELQLVLAHIQYRTLTGN